MIASFTDDERQIVANLQDEFRVGVYVVTPGFRAGLSCGIRRALEAARQEHDLPSAISAMEALLD